MKEKKYRISYLAIFILIVASGLADLLSLIPFVGTIVGPLYWVIVAVYFWSAGLGLINWRRSVPTLISFVGEIIPMFQELPTIILATIVIIVISRIEDKTGVSIMPGKSVPGTKKYLNSNGVREAENQQNRNTNLKPLVVDGMRKPSK